MKQWIEAVPAGHKARIRFDNGRTRSKTFPTARDAKAWLRRSLTEVTDGTFIPEAHGKMPFSDWVDQYVATTVDLASGTVNRRSSDLKNWILPEFGRCSLNAITQPDVKRSVARMARVGCNPGSIKLRYETLSIIMRAAVDAELIRRSPCHHVALPRYEREEMRLLSLDQVLTLAETIDRPIHITPVSLSPSTLCRSVRAVPLSRSFPIPPSSPLRLVHPVAHRGLARD